MSPRVRKLIGLFGILAFLAVYVAVASKLSDLVPKGGPWQAIYFAVVGVVWGVPLFPLITWMNRER
jgi:hypothetical protein